MSIENAQAFKREVYKNPQLVLEYMAIITKTADEDIPQKIADWGREHGYEFSASEAFSVRNHVIACFESGELGDDELELVAGGAFMEKVKNYNNMGDALKKYLQDLVNNSKELGEAWANMEPEKEGGGK
ncbi:MAG: Nif11-like leader peptide family RiPP precursor [Gammaproteobacteria bacterium]|nr:Nif11-like leader peptide family RiPP precursor [Gammaproteobacteria bacterium]